MGLAARSAVRAVASVKDRATGKTGALPLSRNGAPGKGDSSRTRRPWTSTLPGGPRSELEPGWAGLLASLTNLVWLSLAAQKNLKIS